MICGNVDVEVDVWSRKDGRNNEQPNEIESNNAGIII